MTGRDVALGERARSNEPGEPRLRVSELTVERLHGTPVVDGVDLEVRGGEILGIAAIAGNGQNELVEAITGLRVPDAGKVAIDGHDVTASSVRQRRRAGLAYIPEDRHRVGTAGAATVRDNLLMGYQRFPRFQRRGWLRAGSVADHADRLIDGYRIRVADQDTAVGTLSGGNLQKVVVARELEHEPVVLIAEQPTRGVDVGAIEFVHSQLLQARDAGSAVLLISAELWELLALATRIVVMFEGRVVAHLDPTATDELTLGWYMTGSGEDLEGAGG